MTARFKGLETLESRRMLAVTPAYADKMGITPLIDPTPTFVDEFSGTSLDSSKWTVREATRWRPSPSSPDFAWTHRNAVRVGDRDGDGNGELDLIAHNDPATGQLRSGWIQSSSNNPESTSQDPKLLPGSTAKFMQAFGYWEAKIKFNGMGGMWSAFWVHSPKMTSVGNDPSRANHPEIYGTEMDVVENGARRGGGDTRDDMSSVIHANGYNDFHVATGRHTNTNSVPGGSPASNYHIYSLMWTPEYVEYYLDGHRVMRETNPIMVSKAAQLIILSNEIGSPGSSQIGQGRTTWGTPPSGGFGTVDSSNAKMTVDYVRVWKLNGTVGPLIPGTKPRTAVTNTKETTASDLFDNPNGGGTSGGTITGPGGVFEEPTTNPDGTPTSPTLTGKRKLWARGGEMKVTTKVART